MRYFQKCRKKFRLYKLISKSVYYYNYELLWRNTVDVTVFHLVNASSGYQISVILTRTSSFLFLVSPTLRLQFDERPQRNAF